MAVKLKSDPTFSFKWPFGILKTSHWVLPCILLITLSLGTHFYAEKKKCFGYEIAHIFSWNSFAYSFVTWSFYCAGIQRIIFPTKNGLFAPCPFFDFFATSFFTLFAAASTIACVICVTESLDNSWGVLSKYIIATIFSLLSTVAFGYFAIFVYRSCPNGKIEDLTKFIIEADKTKPVQLDEATVTTQRTAFP